MAKTLLPDQWHSAVRACLERKRVLRCADCPHYRKAPDCAYLLDVAEPARARQRRTPTLEERVRRVLDVSRIGLESGGRRG